MAKELSPADLAAAMQAMGLDVPEELQEKIANAMEDEAFHYIVPRIVNVEEKELNETATKWQKNLFDLASEVRSYIKADEKNRGQGRRLVHFLSIETHDGTLKVELSRPLD